MNSPKLKIPFPFNLGETFDFYERHEFWHSQSTRDWFAKRGYNLYDYPELGREGYSRPASLTENLVEDTYPYAYHDCEAWMGRENILRTIDFSGKVIYAQDFQQRHVAIKLVRANSDEYRILRFLNEQSLQTLRENCIIPVLDLLPAEGHWLAVMPRWGWNILSPEYMSYRNLLDIMRSMLKGLAFLHEHNITHRDMKLGNVLVNHFGDDNFVSYSGTRIDLRADGRLSYAVFDFDISIMLPPGSRKEDYLLPYPFSYDGTMIQTRDTSQGEFEYNPFPFDVGTLGVEFCNCFQLLCKDIPMLAPLLDRMTTRDIENRFTAAEALQFFEDRYAELPESLLEKMYYQFDDSGGPFDEYDRWQHLPADFVTKWAAYREPPIPFATKILRSIAASEWIGPHAIPWIRWFFCTVSSYPRRVWTHFVGFKTI